MLAAELGMAGEVVMAVTMIAALGVVFHMERLIFLVNWEVEAEMIV